MKKIKASIVYAVVIATLLGSSCKNKTKENADVPATPNTSTSTADSNQGSVPVPVVITQDEELQKGVKDALKDHPSVKADVTDGVINLKGEIKRADWQKLNPTLNSLHPKRINSTDLTIK